MIFNTVNPIQLLNSDKPDVTCDKPNYIISGKTVIGPDNEIITGTLEKCKDKDIKISFGEIKIIEEGYYCNSTVSINMLPEHIVNVASGDILENYSASNIISEIHGNIIDNTGKEVDADDIYSDTIDNTLYFNIHEGYYNNHITVYPEFIYKLISVNPSIIAKSNNKGFTGTYTSDSTATENDVCVGSIAYSNGNRLSGKLRMNFVLDLRIQKETSDYIVLSYKNPEKGPFYKVCIYIKHLPSNEDYIEIFNDIPNNKKPLDKNTLTIPLQKKGVYRIKVVCKNDQIPDSIPRYLTYSK